MRKRKRKKEDLLCSASHRRSIRAAALSKRRTSLLPLLTWLEVGLRWLGSKFAAR